MGHFISQVKEFNTTLNPGHTHRGRGAGTQPAFILFSFAHLWPTALKLGCITNLDMLFLMLGFISLVDEMKLKQVQEVQSL